MRAATISCASLPATRSIDDGSLGEPPHRVKRGKTKMGADSTPRHNPSPDMRKPLRIPNHPFVGAKYFSPGCRPLVLRNRLSVSAPHHLWHGRNIFRPYARNCCATSTAIFQISAHVYGLGARHGHKIFHPGNHLNSIHIRSSGT